MFDNVVGCKNKFWECYDFVRIGMDIIMLLKLVKFYVNVGLCDKVFVWGDFDKFYCLCKKVNYERKLC